MLKLIVACICSALPICLANASATLLIANVPPQTLSARITSTDLNRYKSSPELAAVPALFIEAEFVNGKMACYITKDAAAQAGTSIGIIQFMITMALASPGIIVTVYCGELTDSLRVPGYAVYSIISEPEKISIKSSNL